MRCYVFDLDDTLFSEADFLKSGYHSIAKTLEKENPDLLVNELLTKYYRNENAFEYASNKYNITISELLHIYRTHFPQISIYPDALNILLKLKSSGHILGLITDGRSITQRNKLKALDIEEIFDKVVISEEFGSGKPDKRNYEIFQTLFKNSEAFYYFGDNTKKDFIAPVQLGWKCYCRLNNGKNIHSQDIAVLDSKVTLFSTFIEISKELE